VATNGRVVALYHSAEAITARRRVNGPKRWIGVGGLAPGVNETKEIVNRKVRTEYRLTKTGRQAFKKYRSAWTAITNGAQRR